MNSLLTRSLTAAKTALPGATRTAWWMVRLTVVASLAVQLLDYFGIIGWLASFLTPVFQMVGLPGRASLVFISGYFLNVYTAIAVMSTMVLNVRTITILSVMILCAHNMIIESAVQKKCGTPLVRIFIIRTLSAFVLGFVLNLIMPAEATAEGLESVAPSANQMGLWLLFNLWWKSTAFLVIKMIVLIYSLSILQRLLAEFGVIRWLSKLCRPALMVFGLPARTSFLWIVANVLGLAYGAAVMIEEVEAGKITKEDADLLNHHIGISHSNLEDVFLLSSVGALFWWLILSRWAMSIILVWERRGEKVLNHLNNADRL